MNATKLNAVLCVLLFGSLPAYAEGNIQTMDAAEKRRNERASKELVAYMSLDAMFPDTSVRALARAAGEGDVKKLDQLVKQGVDVNARGVQNATPLFWALHDYNGFKRLLELGADPNIVFGNGNGGSVIHWAVTSRDGRFLKAVLQHNGNPNLIDNDLGYTPLFVAVDVGKETIDVLLEAGANIDASDRFGNTPAIVAADTGKFEIVYELLERGADYRIIDGTGRDLADAVAAKIGLLKAKSDSANWMKKVVDWLRGKGVIKGKKGSNLILP